MPARPALDHRYRRKTHGAEDVLSDHRMDAAFAIRAGFMHFHRPPPPSGASPGPCRNVTGRAVPSPRNGLRDCPAVSFFDAAPPEHPGFAVPHARPDDAAVVPIFR